MREFDIEVVGVVCPESRKDDCQYWLIERLTSYGKCDEKEAMHSIRGLELTNDEAMDELLKLCASLYKEDKPAGVIYGGMNITISRDRKHIETDWVEAQWVVNPSMRSIINSVYGIACISADPERRKMFRKIILTRLD